MTKHTDEFSQIAEPVACREYTLPRDEETSEPKGWIRGNTKIGPVLEVTTSYLQGKYGVELRIESVNKDNAHSWVRISHGLNKLVTDLIDKEYDDDEQETSTTKTEVFALASRSKAKAKRRRPTSACSSTRTCCLHGKYGVEIRITSMNKDHSLSWVRISHGLNKLVTNLNIEQEISEVQFGEYALRLNAGDFASRSKAKAKPQRRDSASSSKTTIPIGERLGPMLNQKNIQSPIMKCRRN